MANFQVRLPEDSKAFAKLQELEFSHRVTYNSIQNFLSNDLVHDPYAVSERERVPFSHVGLPLYLAYVYEAEGTFERIHYAAIHWNEPSKGVVEVLQIDIFEDPAA